MNIKKSFKLNGKTTKTVVINIIAKDTKVIVCGVKCKDKLTQANKNKLRPMVQEWMNEFKTNKGKTLHFIDNTF